MTLKYKNIALSYNFLVEKIGNFQTNRNYKRDAHARAWALLICLSGIPIPFYRIRKCPTPDFFMTSKKFTQQQAEKMYEILTEIHSSLKDKHQNKKLKDIPFIEMAWKIGIEKHILKKIIFL